MAEILGLPDAVLGQDLVVHRIGEVEAPAVPARGELLHDLGQAHRVDLLPPLLGGLQLLGAPPRDGVDDVALQARPAVPPDRAPGRQVQEEEDLVLSARD